MIIGDPSVFAIESGISQAYDRQSFLALGFFVIYVGGHCYGVREFDATMLACSFNEAKRRIANRGNHIASFAESDAEQIARAFRSAVYADEQEKSYFGIEMSDFRRHFDQEANSLLWAPDGDAAFDDGSYVLHFDLEKRVRLIAFKSIENYGYDPTTLSEAWMAADRFYDILMHWIDSFETEWKRFKK
jgi:hypothetical protein